MIFLIPGSVVHNFPFWLISVPEFPCILNPFAGSFLHTFKIVSSVPGQLPHRTELQTGTPHSLHVQDMSQTHTLNLWNIPTTKTVLTVQFSYLVPCTVAWLTQFLLFCPCQFHFSQTNFRLSCTVRVRTDQSGRAGYPKHGVECRFSLLGSDPHRCRISQMGSQQALFTFDSAQSTHQNEAWKSAAKETLYFSILQERVPA